MSYLVLARKSRPQTFTEVVGQRPVVKTLRNSLLRDRVAHAILFSGVRGVGKTTLARIMAKALNCKAELADRPCNNCDSCRDITKGSALDLYEIDGASNRGIQEIRELKEKIRFMPTSARYRIIIIDEVHMLTTEAFNALLKTLEEPPAHVHFMFATTELHKIPITILSRCQQYELKRIPASELFDHFSRLVAAEGYTIENSALSLIVREAGGSVRDGLSLLDQMFSFGEKEIKVNDVVEILGLVNRDVLLRLTRALLDGKAAEALLVLDEVFTFSMDTGRFLEDLMECYRNLLLCKLEGCDRLLDLPTEELTELTEISGNYTHETVHRQLSMLMKTTEEVKRSTQPRLTLETSLLAIAESPNVVGVATLLGQLDNLLKGFPGEEAPAIGGGSGGSPQAEKKSEKTGSAPDEAPPFPVTESRGSEQKAPDLRKPPEAAPETVVTPKEQAPPEPPPAIHHPKPVVLHPHEKDVRQNWQEFIAYVKERRMWMAQDLQRADAVKPKKEGELHLVYDDPANCSLLRNRENRQLLTEFALDFFQKPLKVRFIIPDIEENGNGEVLDTPHKKRQQLGNDPLVIMAAEIFNGEVGDIRIGPRSR